MTIRVIAAWLLLISFCSCSRHAVRSASFNKELWQDTTLLISDYIQQDKPLSEGWIYTGPYFVQFGKANTDIRKTKNSTNIESNDIFRFSICKDSSCAYAESTFYEKIKDKRNSNPGLAKNPDATVAESVAGDVLGTLINGPKVKARNVSGLISYGIEPARNFQVNVMGKRNGYGFFRLSEKEILSIRPVKKKTGYGGQAFAVALEFTLDEKIIGSFIQSDGIVRIVLKRNLDSKTKLILTALSIALINRQQEIVG